MQVAYEDYKPCKKDEDESGDAIENVCKTGVTISIRKFGVFQRKINGADVVGASLDKKVRVFGLVSASHMKGSSASDVLKKGILSGSVCSFSMVFSLFWC